MKRMTRDESRLQTRERLLASAREVFARAGYGGASVDDIAETAGYSKGAFYSNFATKEAIFLELLETHMAGELAGAEALTGSATTWQAAVDAIAERYATDAQDRDWCLLSVEFALHAARAPAFAAHFARLFERQYAGIAKIARKLAQMAGTRLADPHKVAVQFIALRQGLALDQASASPQLSAKDCIATYRMFMRAALGV
ncbi:MAG TPA: TetR/AcrR family transcriptional regulator [Alphaproteobacteria bacterium]|nr:TetR/AcrR family transcriptional regulator [Alphaproteobacteria bacterium]HAJ47103.1 TetR/AcrR family transcriptional regulator [Alphaproteobacteria bacterium]